MPGVALVGAGRWGPNLARNLVADPEWELRWVCDPRTERSARVARAFDARPSAALEQVLDDPAVTSVVIATPATTHRELVAECLAAGRHVLVEKPLACTALDAEISAADANARGLTLLCDHTYRFTAAAEAIQASIATGAIGALTAFSSARTNAQCGHSDVDVFWDLAHHDLSLIDAFFGGVEPDQVAADVLASTTDGRAATGTLTLGYPTGATARIDVDWDAPAKRRAIEVRGTRGALLWDDLAERPLLLTTDASGPVPLPLPAVEEPLRAVVREFLEVVRGERAPRCGTDVDLRVLAVLERAGPYATLERGCP